MLAVIPAGGRATRFAGVYKDLLPIGDDTFLLSEAVSRAVRMGCDRIAIVTSAEKAAAHERFLREHGIDATLIVSSDLGLWEAIRATFPLNMDSLLILADTVFQAMAMPPVADLAFGVFETDEPGRFSVVSDNTIITKSADLPSPQTAWGCVRWSKAVIAFWEGRGPYEHYDDAFRDAMGAFGFKTFPIESYHDLGTWGAYRAYVGRDDLVV